MTMEVIQHIELGSSASSISFSSIPQTYTDLLIVLSARSTDTTVTANGGYDPFLYRLNSTTTGYSSRALNGIGNAVDSDTDSTRTSSAAGGTWGRMSQWGINNANQTSNTFSSIQIYIPNYTSSASKSVSTDYVTENNATNAFQSISAQLWSNSAAITTVAFALGVGSFATNTSATLFGIRRATPLAAKATGGTITFDYANNKVIHTFTSSGTFTPTENLTGVEYLVIAGGGGGGSDDGGGGGAGGYRSSVVGESSGGGASAESTLSLTSGVGQTVTVGAGGAGSSATNSSGSQGSNSVFGSITATGGGGGKSRDSGVGSSAGGSGGGGSYSTSGNTTPGIGTANQGYNGGSGSSSGTSGGGGGAGSVGADANPSVSGGAGGSGVSSSITGTSVARAGGGGGGNNGTATAGGAAGTGGFPAPQPSPATANTGGGGGGQGNAFSKTGGNGGSGIVIVRYSA